MQLTMKDVAGGSHREAILTAAIILFRRKGYFGCGIGDILEMSGAPKGSLYHHFPNGKEQLAVESVEQITISIERLLDGNKNAPTSDVIQALGENIAEWMKESASPEEAETCAFIASIAAVGEFVPSVSAACKDAYLHISAMLTERLKTEGWDDVEARNTALMVVSILEGSGTVSQSIGDRTFFLKAVETAATLCKKSI